MEMEAQESAQAQNTTDRDRLAADLATACERAEENHQKYLYAMAEMENVRKRMERQLAERLTSGRKSMLTRFLPVLDNLQRALSFDLSSDSLRDGLQATLRGFEAVLAAEQVKQIDVLGNPFDPRVAEAIGTRETGDVPDGTVLDEAQRGYLMGEELLRPAQVIVSKHPES